jgi:putative membrane protein
MPFLAEHRLIWRDPLQTKEIATMKTFLIALSATAMVAACAPAGGDAGMGTATAMPAEMTPTERMAYVTMAAASDLFEIQSSQIALQKSQDQTVRGFAQMLITHHTQTTQQLTAAAQAAGLTPPPPQLMPMQADMIAQLQAADGAGFDRTYLTQQVPAHEMALALHRNYAANGDTPALRTVAAAAVPIVEGHLTQARQLNAR